MHPVRFLAISASIAALCFAAGCGRVGYEVLEDAGPGDAGPAEDAGVRDAGRDAAGDSAMADAGVDAGVDAGCGPPATLLAHYPLDGNVEDVVGSRHATSHGELSYVDGRIGQAASFDGVDDVVRLPSFVRGDVAFSISFWVNTTVVASGGPLAQWVNGMSLIDGEVCGTPATGDWGIALIDGGHIATFSAHSTREVNDGTWHHILLADDVAANQFRIYIDGVMDIELNLGPAVRTFEEVPWLGIGNSPCPSNFLRGAVDDVRFYDRAFDAAEAMELYSCTL